MGDASREVDLVFLCDCTGSMGSYIEEAQKSMKTIITSLQASEKADLHFALICYRDHPPQESSYVTKVFPFTDSVKTAQGYVDTMSAAGGGDCPECIACAMKDILGLDFRKSALKVVVMISDAPPHGLCIASGDGFPEGCPEGNDPMKIALELAQRAIICYTVGVEPTVFSYGTRDWLRAISKITGGRYVPLIGASKLPYVILYGTTEELDLQKLEEQVEAEEAAVRAELGKDALEAKVDELVSERLKSKGVGIRKLDVQGFKEEEFQWDVDKISKMDKMSDVCSYISSTPAKPIQTRRSLLSSHATPKTYERRVLVKPADLASDDELKISSAPKPKSIFSPLKGVLSSVSSTSRSSEVVSAEPDRMKEKKEVGEAPLAAPILSSPAPPAALPSASSAGDYGYVQVLSSLSADDVRKLKTRKAAMK